MKSSEKRKDRIVEQIIKYTKKEGGSYSAYYGRNAFLMKEPEEMINLIRFLYEHQGEVAVILKWANLNKKAVEELTPYILKQVRAILSAQEVHEG